MLPFPDRLAEAVRRSGTALCVGLDPRWDLLPKAVRDRHPPTRPDTAVADFCFRVLELVRPYCGVVKLQAAFFELFGPHGMTSMKEVIAAARQMGFVAILDAKRGDIAGTAQAYADAAFCGYATNGHKHRVWDADALTVNPYLGEDSIEPFILAANKGHRGLFVLVRTSNAGAGLFQDLVCKGKPVYRHVAEAVARWNADTLGESGLGAVGAVVGATHPKELAELRGVLPDCWLLVPGYGAQGGTAKDVRAAFRADGLGAVVNSSRGITYPFHPEDPQWEEKVIDAARKASAELRIG